REWKVIPQRWRLDLDAGAGNDGVSIQGPNLPGDETSVPIYVDMTLRTGAGDDNISLQDFSLDAPDSPGIPGPHRLNIDTGAGADGILVKNIHFHERAGVSFDTGGGDDEVSISSFSMAGGDCTVKLGSDNDKFTLTTSDFSDLRRLAVD